MKTLVTRPCVDAPGIEIGWRFNDPDGTFDEIYWGLAWEDNLLEVMAELREDGHVFDGPEPGKLMYGEAVGDIA